MGGHRQRTVLNEPAHARHLRGRDPTEDPGLVHVGQIPTPPTRHALEAPSARRNGAPSPQADECTDHHTLVTQSLTDTLFRYLARINNKVVHLTAVETQIAHTDAARGSHATRPRRNVPSRSTHD